MSKDLISYQELFVSLLPQLEAQEGWYGSIYFERKSSQSLSDQMTQTQVADHINCGVVFRIYNGITLFEEASDDLNPKNLKTKMNEFIKRVQSESKNQDFQKKYIPPSWKEKLKLTLDPEILSQIPKNVDSFTPVHFGIRYQKDPKEFSTTDTFKKLKAMIEHCKTLAPQANLTPEDLNFILARQSLVTEEALFIDRESNLSQTLYRISLTLICMSGSERSYMRVGGLGGLEAIDYKEEDVLKLLKDLKALKKAERLQPGKYRLLIGPAITGVLAHEAFGHSQEGDTCARGRSKAWELHHSGELVGNEHATILNNPAIYENAGESHAAWGSYFFDEEGWFAQEQILLDQGKLKPPMTNLTSAIRLDIPRSANGKRESWAHGVYTRQTNTYFSAGNKTLNELMHELNNGYLATQSAGGMEDPKGMGIQVGIAYLHEVREGKITGRVVKGPAGGDIQMTGYTPDVLNSIIDKSKIEFEFNSPDQAKHPHNDVGGCGKYHKEYVHAGCGGPYMLLDSVLLG